MKIFKKVASLFLTLAMIMSFTTNVFAEGSKGSITIDNATVGQTYTIYRIFDLESYSGDNYVYKINKKWENFAKSDVAKNM